MDEAKELAQAEAQRRRVPFFEDGAEPAQYDGYAEIEPYNANPNATHWYGKRVG